MSGALIGMIAAPRKPPNARTTLVEMVLRSRLAARSDFFVSFDGTNQAARDMFGGMPGLEVAHGWFEAGTPQVPDDVLARLPRHRRARMNYARLLRRFLDDPRDLILVEDDLAYAPRWCEKICDAAARHPGAVIMGYERHEIAGLDSFRVIEPNLIEHEASHSTLCVYWPADIRRRAYEEISRPSLAVLVTDDRPCDVAIDAWLRVEKVPTYTLIPSVVDHRGDVSLINPHDGIRRGPHFEPSS